MTPRHTFYRKLRESVGSRKYVSKLLGVNLKTLWRRENNKCRITEEMTLALLMLKSNHEKKTRIATAGI